MRIDYEAWVRKELEMVRAFRNQVLVHGGISQFESTVNIDKRNKRDDTILIGVIKYLQDFDEQSYWIQLLIELNADVNLADSTGRTAMMYACICRVPNLGILLMNLDTINMRVQDKNGNTAIMYAASYGHDELLNQMIVFSLRTWGLDHFRTKNIVGNDAHRMAKMAGNSKCAKMLSKARLVLMYRMYRQLSLLNSSARLRGWPTGSEASKQWRKVLAVSRAPVLWPKYAEDRKRSRSVADVEIIDDDDHKGGLRRSATFT